MPKKANSDEKTSLPESEEHLKELYNKIRAANKAHLQKKKEEAAEALCLVRYE